MALHLAARSSGKKARFANSVRFAESSVLRKDLDQDQVEYGDDEENQLQYHHLYRHRLKDLKPRLLSAVEEKFSDYDVRTLPQMPIGYVGVVCGIFIKRIKLQPEVLDEYLDDVDKPDLPNKLTDEDELGFEDETQRTAITGITTEKIREIVTGEVVAILGKIIPTGEFEVLDWTSPAPPTRQKTEIESSAVVAFCGDFRFGTPRGQPNFLELELFSNFVTCAVGEENEQVGQIARLVVSGLVNCGTTYRKFKNGKNDVKDVSAAYRIADEWLSQISRFLPVDIVTAGGDCGSQSLPCSPLHKLIFKKTAAGEMKCHPSPLVYSVNGTSIMNIPEIMMKKMKEYSAWSDDLDILAKLLRVSHMAPIAPDIISTVPCQKSDPFTMHYLPDVIWCMGDEFASKTIPVGDSSVLAFVTPRFSDTSSIALLRTKTSENDPPTVQKCQFTLPDFA